MANNTNWAARGKAAVASKPVGRALGGSLESIVAYYSPKPLTETSSPLARHIAVGDRLEGVYEGTYEQKGTTKTGRPFTAVQHKLRTEEGLVAIASNFSLKRIFADAKEGEKVTIFRDADYSTKSGGAGYAFRGVADSEE